jgi:hypothetical protein
MSFMKHVATLFFVIVVVASAIAAIGPVVLTGPFRAQTAADLDLAYKMSQWAPGVTLAALIVGVILAAAIWRGSAGLKTKLGIVLGCMVLGIGSYLSRQSFAERTFAALPEVVRIPVAESSHVLPNDLVLGVTQGSEAAAYPIPIIGYHHIVNDELGEEPYVVTY